jgi:uncharacterized membrane protein YqjE
MDPNEHSKLVRDVGRERGLDEKAMLCTHVILAGLVVAVLGIVCVVAASIWVPASRFKNAGIISILLGVLVAIGGRWIMMKAIRSAARAIRERSGR